MLKHILKHSISAILILGFTFSFMYSFSGSENLFSQILSCAGWLVAVGFFIFYLQFFNGIQESFSIKEMYLKDKEIKLLKQQEYLRELSKVISEKYKDLNEYNEKFDENFGIYQMMIKDKGISVPVANTIIDFALNIDAGDTIFLVRVNSDENMWHMKIGGKPIHYVWARETLYMVANQCDKVASPNYIIWRPEEILN
jgi:hypothetical protein